MPGKRIQFSDETWPALDFLMKSKRRSLQELADEAFSDLLAKYDAPVSLADQLRKSVDHDAPKPALALKPVRTGRAAKKPAKRAKA